MPFDWLKSRSKTGSEARRQTAARDRPSSKELSGDRRRFFAESWFRAYSDFGAANDIEASRGARAALREFEEGKDDAVIAEATREGVEGKRTPPPLDDAGDEFIAYMRYYADARMGGADATAADAIASTKLGPERRWLFAEWWLRALTDLGAKDDIGAARGARAALEASDAGSDEANIEKAALEAIRGRREPPPLSGPDANLIIFARQYANARRAGADRETAQAAAIAEHERLAAETRANLDAHYASRAAGHAPTSPAPPTPEGRAATIRHAEEVLIDVAKRTVPTSTTPTHFFIVSGNRSLIKAYNDLFRVGAPTYGGSAAVYRGDAGTLQERQDASGAMRFAGQRSMGARSEAAADVATVLGSVRVHSPSGSVFVAHVSVGPNGQAWVRDVYTTVMKDAVRQGILPYPMYETDDSEAARYLLESLTAESIS